MNYLELVVSLRKECSVAGNGPVTINDSRAEYQRLIKWIDEANREIQGKYANWRFLWSKGSFDTEADLKEYVPGEHLPLDINVYRHNFFSINGNPPTVKEYSDLLRPFYHEMHYGEPTQLIIMPNNAIMLWPIPDKAYPVNYEYYKHPQTLSEADDIPWIPETWHKLIVYRGMMLYGDYENAPEVKNAGAEGLASIMPQLEANQLPGQRDMAMVNEYDLVVQPL